MAVINVQDKMFSPIISNVRIGLVRLNRDLVIIDKNRMADSIFGFPKRGSSIVGSLLSGADVLSELGMACASVVGVRLTDGCMTKNAIAFRERDSGILLLLHPLLSSAYFDPSESRFKRMLSHYCVGIYGIIEEMDGRSGFSCSGLTAYTDLFEPNVLQKDYSSVKTAVRKALDKISAAVLKKKLTVVVDKIYSDSVRGVDRSRLEYTLGEMIALRELYGETEDAVIEIGVAEDCLAVTLRDRVCSDDAVKYYVRILCEVLKTMDIGTYTRASGEGDLVIKAFVPFVRVNSLMCDEFELEWENYGYIQHCLDYIGI